MGEPGMISIKESGNWTKGSMLLMLSQGERQSGTFRRRKPTCLSKSQQRRMTRRTGCLKSVRVSGRSLSKGTCKGLSFLISEGLQANQHEDSEQVCEMRCFSSCEGVVEESEGTYHFGGLGATTKSAESWGSGKMLAQGRALDAQILLRRERSGRCSILSTGLSSEQVCEYA